jgi:hypothetical protein
VGAALAGRAQRASTPLAKMHERRRMGKFLSERRLIFSSDLFVLNERDSSLQCLG